MKWISVGDSLPETRSQFQMVIVASNKGIGVANYNKVNGFERVVLNGGTQYSRLEISHWMYLPEDPVS
ncbi:hypothetical protein CWS43_09730 [Rahnella sp. AA]|uniref:DUF551 domain-containing protein n=1 Tax=Rahnella sp. AA TaxID=2057180 RepID=UPI000C34077A|nr:DUF551 domain-containing protein [Rahnella sp. AA]PKE30951.1 hypothetical protein CWS43_09730 [Rahnella sp. AA]